MSIEDDILKAIKQKDSNQLASLLNSITTLNLWNMDIGDSGAIQIGKALEANKTITTLMLGYNRIGKAGASAIAKALETNQTPTLLNLEYNPIGGFGASIIAKALEANKTLTSLSLCWNEIGDSGASTIAKALEVNQTLTYLSLSYNQIGYSGASQIAKALESNQTLTSLTLYTNQIGDKGAIQIANALEANKTLTSLDLQNNQFGDAGASQIAKALESNQTLISLNIYTNQIGKQMEKINNLMRRNCRFQNDCINALKQNNLSTAKTLLNQGVSPNGVLFELARETNTQLKAIQHLFQLIQNNSLPILRGVVLNAIKEAENKNHFDVVNFLQQMLQNIHSAQEKKREAKSFDHSHLIPYANLTIGHELGKGSFGIVYQGKWQLINVAIKQLYLNQLSNESLTEFRTEAATMTKLHHPHVVTLHGVSIDQPGKYSLVMEYMPKGSLYAVLHNQQPLDWNLRYRISLDICAGLLHLHEQNILHRDLKSMNVLLDDRMRAKLSDFGLSKLRTETTTTATQAGIFSGAGTLPWMAPELFKRKEEDTKASDMYSLGMVFWEIASRLVPFADAKDPQQIIAWKNQGEHEDIPEDCPPEYVELITWCWQEQTKRPTIHQAEEVLEQMLPENAQSSLDTIYQSGPVYQQDSLKLSEENKSMPNYQLDTLSIKP